MSNPISASVRDTDNTQKPTLNALLEVAGLWWLMISAGVLLIAALLLQVYGREVDSIQQSRVSLTIAELQEAIETDIALGLDLAENHGITFKLEAALAADASLHAIDVVSRNGVALFSTDRGAVGERWQAAVTTAADAGMRGNHRWSTVIDNETVSGVLLHNAFGEVIGHVTATYAAPPSRLSAAALRVGMPLWMAALASLAVLAMVSVLAARWALAPQYRHLEAERAGALNASNAKATEVRARLDECLAKLDAMEAAE